jgi:hypothetical protein
MTRAHGLYAALHLLLATACGYIRINNKKKKLETLWIVGPTQGDDSMAYTSSALAPRDLAFTQPSVTQRSATKSPARPQRSLIGRLLDAVMVARQREAEREVARYLASTGGKFTDEAEREIERRFLSNPSHW